MSDQNLRGSKLVSFGERLASSANFSGLFREGMDLIEETAVYLDGQGRAEAKALDRSASLSYATESMRLTTRLMQLASWLLLHRAVKEGEMTLAQANRDKTKVKLNAPEPGAAETVARLPEALRDLITRSMALQASVKRLDSTLHAAPAEKPVGAPNSVESQMGKLRAAFEPANPPSPFGLKS
jgi:regulator of CtrA degradation